MRATIHRTVLSVAAGAAFAASFLLPGCNIVGPAYYLIHGPDKDKKLFALEKERPTVIFIDDRSNRLPRSMLRGTIAKEAENSLLKKQIVKDMISSDSAAVAAGHDRYEKPMAIAEIGQAVGAEVVIYASVDQFYMSPDGQSFSPMAKLRVKVVDAKTDTRLWPEEPRGYSLTVQPHVSASELPTSTAGRYGVEDELAKQVGQELAWLFFDHEAPTGAKAPD